MTSLSGGAGSGTGGSGRPPRSAGASATAGSVVGISSRQPGRIRSGSCSVRPSGWGTPRFRSTIFWYRSPPSRCVSASSHKVSPRSTTIMSLGSGSASSGCGKAGMVSVQPGSSTLGSVSFLPSGCTFEMLASTMPEMARCTRSADDPAGSRDEAMSQRVSPATMTCRSIMGGAASSALPSTRSGRTASAGSCTTHPGMGLGVDAVTTVPLTIRRPSLAVTISCQRLPDPRRRSAIDHHVSERTTR